MNQMGHSIKQCPNCCFSFSFFGIRGGKVYVLGKCTIIRLGREKRKLSYIKWGIVDYKMGVEKQLAQVQGLREEHL